MLSIVVLCVAAAIALGEEGVSDSDKSSSLADAVQSQNWKLSMSLLQEDVANARSLQSDGMSALHWAALHGHEPTTAALLKAGADANLPNEYGLTPLSIACSNGAFAIVKLLVDQGVKLDWKGRGEETLLMLAARHGDPATVKLLIAHGCNPNQQERRGQTALMFAAANGNAEAAEAIIAAGADINVRLSSGFTPMLFAAREGHWNVIERLLKAGVDVNGVIESTKTFERAPRKGMSALLLALESGHFELAIRLVDAGADPNDQRSGFTPLHSVIWVRKTKIGDNPDGDPPPRITGDLTSLRFVRKLAARGADVNRRLDARNSGKPGKAQLNPEGTTPFLMASLTADLPLLKLLLELGADPTIPNVDNCFPFQAAAGVGVTSVGEEPGTTQEVLEVLQFLLAYQADVNAVDKNGETAMHGAAYRSYPEVADFLAAHGAKSEFWNKKNKHNWTPIRIAEGYRPGSLKPSPEMLAALKRAMNH
jgi:uncharacterized protein